MLTIPDSIKNLYKTDGTKKNIRIHFPNNEYPDITNDNIVRESLHFTESLCSQDTFRFGLAEASVLEIETVGIGNMYGMTIEASIEIDGSSLSAADKATIASGTWDGTWDAVNEVFAIPLGVFRVESCPRDHQVMTHRKVTAYSVPSSVVSPVMYWRINNIPNVFYDVIDFSSIKDFVAANYGYVNPQFVADNYTASALTPSTVSSAYHTWDIELSTGTFHMTITRDNKLWQSPSNVEYVVSINRGDFDNSSFISQVEAELTTLGITDERDVFAVVDYARFLASVKFVSGSWYYAYNYLGNLANPYYIVTKDIPIMIMDKGRFDLSYPTKIRISYTYTPTGGTAVSGIIENTFSPSTPPTVNRLTHTWADANIPFSIAATSSFKLSNVGLDTYRMWTNSVDLQAVVDGYFESLGVFGKNARNGTIDIFAIDNLSSISITPDDYSEMWWDEYDVSPIGEVLVSYASSGGLTSTPISIGAGESVYDATQNAMLSLINADVESAIALFQGDFASHASKVGFTPVDMVMQGWPWLEAGDALEITAEDGTVVDTYALRVEMSGIQNLQMSITAQGGQIIGEV